MLYSIVYISVPSFSFTALLLCKRSSSFVYTCPPCLPLSFPCLLLCPMVLYIPCFTSFIALQKTNQKKKNKTNKQKKTSLCLALPNMSTPVVPFLYPPPNDFSFLVNAFMFLVYVPKHQDVSNTNTPRTLMLPV